MASGVPAGEVRSAAGSSANEQLRASVARIFDARGDVVGAGFLVSERHLVTCAHVVAQALGLPHDTPSPPAREVRLDFPLIAPQRLLASRVVGWHPVRCGGDIAPECPEDIAALELAGDPPEGVSPARLVAAADPWGHPFRAFGFPAGYDTGVWASGVLRAGQANGQVQVEDVKATGYFVASGFSGCPVWEE